MDMIGLLLIIAILGGLAIGLLHLQMAIFTARTDRQNREQLELLKSLQPKLPVHSRMTDEASAEAQENRQRAISSRH